MMTRSPLERARAFAAHERATAEGRDLSDLEADLRCPGNDAAADLAIKLVALRAHSYGLWEMTISTALADSEAKQQEALATATSVLDAWSDALAAFGRGDIDAARESLKSAARAAEDWGDDSNERAALALLTEPS